MHRLELARRALRSLRRIPQDRARSIFAALDELAALPDPSTHPNVKAMKGDWKGCLRIRIGSYRAVFQLSDDPLAESEVEANDKPRLISVLVVGPRGDIYKG
jgi:mRNA-degrading endonuclease RelE of RelBE toxin-antitoxin system